MAEVAFVVGLVASVIGIIDGVKTVWDSVKDPKGQPEAFRQVAARLPLVLSILENVKLEAKKLDETAQEDLEKVLESCKEKAEKLNKIFKKVIPGGEDGRLDRYRKAVSAPFVQWWTSRRVDGGNSEGCSINSNRQADGNCDRTTSGGARRSNQGDDENVIISP